jgi:3-methyladenine DNA glycosylase AlkD
MRDMPENMTAQQFIERLEAHRSPAEAARHASLQSGADDLILGVRMGQVFALAKEFMDMPLDEVEKLLDSHAHEARVGAVSIMDFQARRKKTPADRKRELCELYLRRHDRINSWDLVDRAAPYVVGGYLFDKPRDALYRLAGSADIWERRTAIVSTGYFIRQGDVNDTFEIAEMLLGDEEDLIHKAAGWMLRAAGDQDRPKLLAFLDRHAATMPRAMLRYAIEHLDQEQRGHYMSLKMAKGE